MSGAFELNSVTPTTVDAAPTLTTGGIFGSSFPQRPSLLQPANIALGVSALALVFALTLLVQRRGGK